MVFFLSLVKKFFSLTGWCGVLSILVLLVLTTAASSDTETAQALHDKSILKAKNSYSNPGNSVLGLRVGDKALANEAHFSLDIMKKFMKENAGKESHDWNAFTERYSHILPPKTKHSKSNLQLALNEHGSGGSLAEGVMLLDLDKCCFFGNDANDLGIALQWMNRSFEDVKTLYRLLLNPCAVKAFKAVECQHQPLRLVLYTARATLLHYQSGVREGESIGIGWNSSWLVDGQLYVPPSSLNADDILAASEEGLVGMLPEEREDLRRAVERLLAARCAVRDGFGLDEMPHVVVTATAKDVERTVRNLGFVSSHAMLWDDNPRLRGEPHVVTVEPFVRLAPPQRQQVLKFLNDTLPAEELDSDLVDFMLSADLNDRALVQTLSETVEYRLPEIENENLLESWPLLPLTKIASTNDFASPLKNLEGNVVLKTNSGAWGDGSDVTPDNEVSLTSKR